MSNHITGHTGLLCLLGSPVAHSVSPEMHNEACSQLGLDYTYLAFDVPEEFLFGLLTMIFHSVRHVGFHLYMAVSTLQLTSIRNLSEYWQLLLKHTSRCRSIFGFHILLSDTAVESCVTFKPRKAPIQLI